MNIFFSKKSQKYFYKLQPRIAKKLIEGIEKIPIGDIKPIKGKQTPPLFRLRIGKYRIIFLSENDNLKILKIDTRGDVYK